MGQGIGPDVFARAGSLFGGRLYPLTLPEELDLSDGASYPCAYYRFDERLMVPGVPGSAGALVFSVWETTPDGLAAAKAALRDLLDGWKEGDVRTCVFESADDLQDSGTSLYQGIVRFNVKYMQR